MITSATTEEIRAEGPVSRWDMGIQLGDLLQAWFSVAANYSTQSCAPLPLLRFLWKGRREQQLISDPEYLSVAKVYFPRVLVVETVEVTEAC